MADITKCEPSKECKLKEKCYRFRANPHPHWQSYCDFSLEILEIDGKQLCSAYLELWKEKKK